MIDSVLDFYSRAAEPAWWALFDRQDAEFEVLIEVTALMTDVAVNIAEAKSLSKNFIAGQDRRRIEKMFID